MSGTTLTPMMAQWQQCKVEAKDALLFFRLGDFYEAFEKDAEVISKELGLTLTKRQNTYMCGVPFHAAEMYIDKLVSKGFKVAVAEQVEDPKEVKGIVKREIVRTVTPGTLVGSNLLSEKKNNFFASIAQVGSTFGLSFIDLSTGEFVSIELDSEQELTDELFRIKPAEILAGSRFQEVHAPLFHELSHGFAYLLSSKAPLDLKSASEVLQCHFQLRSLEKFSLRGKPAATSAAGSLLLYLKEEMNLGCEQVFDLKTETLHEYMGLDRSSLRNLELLESTTEGSSKASLLGILDQTLTPMGARSLAKWIKHPLLSLEKILERQSGVQLFLEKEKERRELRERLGKVRDLERLSMKVSAGYANPRDLLALASSLSLIPSFVEKLSLIYEDETLLKIQELKPHFEKILNALVEQPPIRVTEGGVFQKGFHPELDELKTLTSESTTFLANYQNILKEKTGIKTLKVGFTRAFGYYIEVSAAQANKVPEEFQRKQTLVNGERFITEELKEFERKALTAEAKAKALEASLFEKLVLEAAEKTPLIHAISKSVGKIDTLLSLAEVASEQRWNKPLLDESDRLEIKEGRHPIVESVVGPLHFISNNTSMSENEQLMLITGPNMAGKSTYIRQVALIVILAQIGSYVPAKEAHIGLVDKVFSRIGASDDLARGQSTFMVEMSETANILKNATSRSLVLLDEIGRGTSTYDGISIAWAVAEYLLTTGRKQAKTLFATHYWELTKLADEFTHAKNYQVAVKETENDIVLLRKIIQGGTDKSYGIHVAKLAGIPTKAIKKAEEMLKDLEKMRKRRKLLDEQLSLFGSPQEETPLAEEIKHLNVQEMTPIEALQKLLELQNSLL